MTVGKAGFNPDKVNMGIRGARSFSEKEAVLHKTELHDGFIAPYFINISKVASSSWTVFKTFFLPSFISIFAAVFEHSDFATLLGFDDMWAPICWVLKEVLQRNPKN